MTHHNINTNIFKHLETGRQTDRETDRETEIEREWKSSCDNDTHTGKER